ncbi:MBL fold metallo-hydrolase [Streptomyces sp. NPDC049040]|uniref:MBL fold metallo-hydrolase n=1 Tax=Streptomyces sp. NPDC049040 TaxID=3365593 RepID=UPI0037198FFE
MNRTRGPGFNRRLLLQGAAAGAAAPALATTGAAAAAAPARAAGGPREGAAAEVVFQWFGTSGWRMDVDGRTVLFDPYLTRFPTGLFTGKFDPKTKLTTNEELVSAHMGRPEVVLVSHSHWDHLNDVPFIATATSAQIVGTETTYHLLKAFGVDTTRIIVVKGGEILDFGGYAVEVVSSRHSRNASRGYFAPGTLNGPADRPRPETIADLPEGDTLAFHVTFDGGPSAFLMGASDFSERDAAGLAPDVAMIATPTSSSTRNYVSRLLTALGGPPTVVPVHWDNFETSLAQAPQRDPAVDWDGFVRQVRSASPRSRIVVPEYVTPYRFR